MKRPLLLDLFCGAGGAAKGYHDAGFDVVGVDINPQPHYPYRFVQADAMTFPLDGYDAIHASPPCRDHSMLARVRGAAGTGHLLAATRIRLAAHGLPYVIENVAEADMPGALVLCGTEFGLHTTDQDGRERWLKRHRRFESNVMLFGAGGCNCYGRRIGGVYGGGGGAPRTQVSNGGRRRGGYQLGADQARTMLDVPWMNRNEAAQAIPPAYTRFIGEQLLCALCLDPDTYRRSAETTTSVTVTPSDAALSLAADQSSSSTRIDRGGVCVGFTSHQLQLEVAEGPTAVVEPDDGAGSVEPLDAADESGALVGVVDRVAADVLGGGLVEVGDYPLGSGHTPTLDRVHTRVNTQGAA